MSSSEAARVPSGVPTGAQFSSTRRAESTIALAPTPAPRHFGDLSDYEVDPSFPVPQANDLEKVLLVCEAVENGATTSDALAEALDVSPREGSYYANAAGYLGIVSVDSSAGLNEYHQTSLGETLRHADPNTQAEMMAQMVALVPEVQIYAEDGIDGLRSALAATDLTGATVTRRAECIRSWASATDDRTGLSRRIEETCEGSRDRFAGAAASARTQLDAARAAHQPVERPVSYCSSCFIALPVTGVCDGCD